MDASRSRRARALALAMPRSNRFVALILALLFAVSWQSFVTQTHNHYDLGFVSAGTAAQADELYAPKTDTARSGKHTPTQLPDDCPLCREVAHAGAVLLPPSIEIAAPALIASWVAVAALIALALAGRSHAWQSRAPPLLQD
jgi:hypothetical protein